MSTEIMALAAGVFVLRVMHISISTVRTLLTVRGSEVSTALLGFVEVLVFVLGLGPVVTNLTSIPILFAYCLGFSVGSVVGLRVERRLALGYTSLRVISRALAGPVAEALRGAGYGATLSWGEGRDGTVGIVTAVVPRRETQRALSSVREVDADAFVVADEARAVTRGWLPVPARR